MRIRALAGIGVLHTALLAPAARAEGARERGPELALRLGLALPAGSINDGTHLDSYASTAVPLIFEGGYRVDANLFLGARFQYAFPQLKNPNGSCSGNTSCSGSIVTLGVEGTYRFLPEQTFAPWLGLGFAYEWASAEYDAPNGGLGATNKGFQVLAQGGGDVRVSSQLVLGPFVEAAFGRYESRDGWLRLGNATTSSSADITNTAWHTWISFGVRGAFGF
ncbi:MAG TPA: hypothetical protein VGK52_13145 [Polyangia bacterium]|jgi:hypothetical protein